MNFYEYLVAFYNITICTKTKRRMKTVTLNFRKSCIGQKTLSYIGPKTWNNLPAQIKLSKNVNTFKHDIKKSFFDDLQKQNDDIFFYY